MSSLVTRGFGDAASPFVLQGLGGIARIWTPDIDFSAHVHAPGWTAAVSARTWAAHAHAPGWAAEVGSDGWSAHPVPGWSATLRRDV